MVVWIQESMAMGAKRVSWALGYIPSKKMNEELQEAREKWDSAKE